MLHAFADWSYLQARLCEQEAATAEQSACAQQLQEAVETGKGKLAESAAFMQKLQDEQSRAREQITEYAAQVMNKHRKKKRKDYASRRQFDEKPNIIPGCPGIRRC